MAYEAIGYRFNSCRVYLLTSQRAATSGRNWHNLFVVSVFYRVIPFALPFAAVTCCTGFCSATAPDFAAAPARLLEVAFRDLKVVLGRDAFGVSNPMSKRRAWGTVTQVPFPALPLDSGMVSATV